MKIYPSLISADILNLRSVIKTLDSHCDGYHIDVMDDHFVSNLTWGPAFVEAIVSETKLPIHMHLMVDNPEKWVGRVGLRDKDFFIFHHEVVSDALKILNNLKDFKHKVGVAINPETPVEDIFSYLDKLDYVLIMSVKPGFSGQKFMPEVLEKVRVLVDHRESKSLNFIVGMDGGIGLSNVKLLADAGVDEVGVASAVFSDGDPVRALGELYETRIHR